MRTINRLRDTNYELVYSTRDPKAGSRNGSAGNRPSRRRSGNSGSRNGGAGDISTAGNFEKAISGLKYFADERRKSYTPADVIKKHQDIRKRGEDKKGEGSPRRK